MLTLVPVLTTDIITQCDFQERSNCSDYCANPDAFIVSNDTADTMDAFSMLTNQEKLEDFCSCSRMAEVDCSASQSQREKCESFCTTFGQRYVRIESDPDTLWISQSVLIRGAASFQGVDLFYTVDSL